MQYSRQCAVMQRGYASAHERAGMMGRESGSILVSSHCVIIRAENFLPQYGNAPLVVLSRAHQVR